MQRAAEVIFFFNWLVCCGSGEKVCDDPRAAAIFAIAVLVAIACAYVMGGKHD